MNYQPAGHIDMRLPTPSKWVPSDGVSKRKKAKPVAIKPARSSKRYTVDALLAALRGLFASSSFKRLGTPAIRDALNTDDINLSDYLRRLALRGYLKRETIRGRVVYSLARGKSEHERQREAREKQRAKARNRAKAARIRDLKLGIAVKQRALQRLGC